MFFRDFNGRMGDTQDNYSTVIITPSLYNGRRCYPIKLTVNNDIELG